jgi:hypothetical protein
MVVIVSRRHKENGLLEWSTFPSLSVYMSSLSNKLAPLKGAWKNKLDRGYLQ